jgi:hypothetical protein
MPPLPDDKKKPVNFDPELPPWSDVNRRAAASKQVRFDVESGYYRDDQGQALYDYSGQALRAGDR